MGFRAKRSRPQMPTYLLRQPADQRRTTYSVPKNTTRTISYGQRTVSSPRDWALPQTRHADGQSLHWEPQPWYTQQQLACVPVRWGGGLPGVPAWPCPSPGPPAADAQRGPLLPDQGPSRPRGRAPPGSGAALGLVPSPGPRNVPPRVWQVSPVSDHLKRGAPKLRPCTPTWGLESVHPVGLSLLPRHSRQDAVSRVTWQPSQGSSDTAAQTGKWATAGTVGTAEWGQRPH